MSVIQEKNKSKWTKDGRSWSFRVYYVDLNGIRRQHQSVLYKTKKEAEQAEREWKNKELVHSPKNSLTFKDLYNLFYEFQKTRVKETTFSTYTDRVIYLEPLDNVKLVDFGVKHYEHWRNWIDQKDISRSYKNDIQKFLKAILNFGTKIHKYNFSEVYPCITPFKDENEEPKEMDFYTLEEFQYFLKNVPDFKYKCLFKTLFYCGLRNGEMRGLKWSRIDWDNKELKILKQIPTKYSSRHFKETSLKTNGSKRTIPIADTLFEDLKKYHDYMKSTYSSFSEDWYVFGDFLPIVADNPGDYQKKICRHIGLKVIRIHDFRHSCASFLIANGADILTVSKFLGHTKVEETLRTYAHLYKNKLSEIVNLTNKVSDETKNIAVEPQEMLKKTLMENTNSQLDQNAIMNALNTIVLNAIKSGTLENLIKQQ